MIDPFVIAALIIMALATVAMFSKEILRLLGGFWWRLVLLVDYYLHDDEDEPCPGWADPEKWEASKI